MIQKIISYDEDSRELHGAPCSQIAHLLKIDNLHLSSLRVATGINPTWELEDSNNIFECTLYRDVGIMIRRPRAEALKKMASLFLCVLTNFSENN